MSIYPTDRQRPVQGPQDRADKRLHHGEVELTKDSGGGQEGADGLHRTGQEKLRQTISRRLGRYIQRDIS